MIFTYDPTADPVVALTVEYDVTVSGSVNALNFNSFFAIM